MTDPNGSPDPDATDLAATASSTDARAGLRAALALRRLAERLESVQVANARRQGWSWQDIAEALEVSKQAVHKKHSGRAPGPGEG
jgi:DNA-directed RNA polymerase specialized sigma24 family protein